MHSTTIDMTPALLFLILIAAIPVAAIFGGILLAALKILKGDSRGTGLSDQEETRMIQEIHRGLNRLEERVEALETLLLDRPKDRSRHD